MAGENFVQRRLVTDTACSRRRAVSADADGNDAAGPQAPEGGSVHGAVADDPRGDPAKPSTRLSEARDTLPSVSAHRQMERAKLTNWVN